MGETASYEAGKICSLLAVLPAVNIVLRSTTAEQEYANRLVRIFISMLVL